MPIPEFTPDGLLPPGVHECTIDEIRLRFGTFQSTDRRPRLFEKLEQFLHEARQSGLILAAIVDGSFVTSAPGPNDVDLILLVKPDHDFSAELRPFEYNVVSQRQARKRYQLDALVAADGSPEATDYLDLFAQVRGRRELRKGLLRLSF